MSSAPVLLSHAPVTPGTAICSPAGAYFCAVIVEVQHIDQTHAAFHFRKQPRLFPLHLFRNGDHLRDLLGGSHDQPVVVSEYDFARMDANAAA